MPPLQENDIASHTAKGTTYGELHKADDECHNGELHLDKGVGLGVEDKTGGATDNQD